MEILGYIAAFFMGLTLGSIGGGGSILTVPILVYLMGVDPTTATGYSLLLVGSVAAFGSYRYIKQGMVDVRAALLFAIPSVLTVYLARAYIMPNIPDPVFSDFSKDRVIMVFFATLMVAAAVMMLRSQPNSQAKSSAHHPMLIALEGAVVGVITGILGAGGGFLIIPALVLLMGMPMKQAVGASLLIIALKSLLGFIGDLQAGIDWANPMLLYFFVITALGMWAATHFAKRIEGAQLQRGFAVFTLIVAGIIFFQELS